MTTYTDITNGQVDVDSPITSSLMTALRNNPLAIAERDTTAPQMFFRTSQQFTSSGTWTRPSNVGAVLVEVVGGGGGVNSALGVSWCVGGGGAGAYGRAICEVSGNVTVTIGAGGSNAGGNGGTSSFGTFISCTGGTGVDRNQEGYFAGGAVTFSGVVAGTGVAYNGQYGYSNYQSTSAAYAQSGSSFMGFGYSGIIYSTSDSISRGGEGFGSGGLSMHTATGGGVAGNAGLVIVYY